MNGYKHRYLMKNLKKHLVESCSGTAFNSVLKYGVHFAFKPVFLEEDRGLWNLAIICIIIQTNSKQTL